MSTRIVHDFVSDAAASALVDPTSIETHLARLYPGVAMHRADLADDRRGVDFWGKWKLNRPIGIDVKFRSQDCRGFGKDDVALEIWSSNQEKVGWARDREKITDRIAFLWLDTQRVVTIPFRPMVECTIENWKQWERDFPSYENWSSHKGNEYSSEVVMVPLTVLHAAMKPYLLRRSGMELPKGFKFCRHPDCIYTAQYPCEAKTWCHAHHDAIQGWFEPESMRERREELEAINASVNAAKYDARKVKTQSKAAAKRNNDEFARIMKR